MSSPEEIPGGAYGTTGRFLVPLDQPRIVQWFLDHLYVVHGWRQRLLRGLLRRVPGVMGGVPSEDGRVLRYLREELGPLLETSGFDPKAVHCIGVRDYAGTARRRYVVFLFREGAERPGAVVKLRAVNGSGESLAREAGTLRRLPNMLPDDLAGTVPRCLGYRAGSPGSPEALIQSALEGVSLYVDQRTAGDPARLASRHLGAAARWIARFQVATMQRGGAASLVVGHGDFWHRNLLLPSGGGEGVSLPGVVDWEASRREASPLGDLFHFPLWYVLRSPGAEAAEAASFERGFVADTPLRRAVGGYFSVWRNLAAAGGLEEAQIDLRSAFLEHLEQRYRDTERPIWRRLQQSLEKAARSAFCG